MDVNDTNGSFSGTLILSEEEGFVSWYVMRNDTIIKSNTTVNIDMLKFNPLEIKIK